MPTNDKLTKNSLTQSFQERIFLFNFRFIWKSYARRFIISIISQRIYHIHLQMNVWIEWAKQKCRVCVCVYIYILFGEHKPWNSAMRFQWMIRIFYESKSILFSSRTGSLIYECMLYYVTVYHDKYGLFKFQNKKDLKKRLSRSSMKKALSCIFLKMKVWFSYSLKN